MGDTTIKNHFLLQVGIQVHYSFLIWSLLSSILQAYGHANMGEINQTISEDIYNQWFGLNSQGTVTYFPIIKFMHQTTE